MIKIHYFINNYRQNIWNYQESIKNSKKFRIRKLIYTKNKKIYKKVKFKLKKNIKKCMMNNYKNKQ